MYNINNKYMIIIRLSGGLGNQMFQYALGRAISIKNNTELAVDISSFLKTDKKQTPRTFKLTHFNIKAKISDTSDFEKINIPNASDYSFLGKLKKKLFRLKEFNKPIHKKKFIIERQYTFDKNILETGENCFLTGVW